MRKYFYAVALLTAGVVFTPHAASALPLSSLSGNVAEARDALVQKVWHSGLPHRRIIGNRVYGGTCPPQGCPAWTQRDLRRDPVTGEWYSPENERQRYEDRRRRHRRNW